LRTEYVFVVSPVLLTATILRVVSNGDADDDDDKKTCVRVEEWNQVKHWRTQWNSGQKY